MELKETKRAAMHQQRARWHATRRCWLRPQHSCAWLRRRPARRSSASTSSPVSPARRACRSLGIVPSIGDTVTGHFIYDTEALDQDPGDPTHGQYSSGSIQIEIGGLMLSSAATAQQVTWDVDGPNDIWFHRCGLELRRRQR